MPKYCQITGKIKNNAYSVSHSHVRTKKIQHVNLQKKKVWCKAKQKWINMRISTKAIKQLTKNN
jgi:large subunit ribosomal protein L28|uniref:Large ribosomal subunit protein bL28c n=1 Tax=Thorea hispida TaxID=202687 RepID=A0A1Z1XAP2_9FLOR|nr:ribosomal protein L28 [Thorea hispida]